MHQCSFAQQVGIALAVAGNSDELAGDGPFDVLVAVSDPQSEANKFEGDTEARLVSASKFWSVKNAVNGMALPSDRRERDWSLSYRRLSGRAVVDSYSRCIQKKAERNPPLTNSSA